MIRASCGVLIAATVVCAVSATRDAGAPAAVRADAPPPSEFVEKGQDRLLGQVKIEKHRLAVRGQEHVGWLHVHVDEAAVVAVASSSVRGLRMGVGSSQDCYRRVCYSRVTIARKTRAMPQMPGSAVGSTTGPRRPGPGSRSGRRRRSGGRRYGVQALPDPYQFADRPDPGSGQAAIGSSMIGETFSHTPPKTLPDHERQPGVPAATHRTRRLTTAPSP